MAAPVDPRLLRRARATRGYLVAGVVVGSTTAVLTLAQAWFLSRSIADVTLTGSLSTIAWALGGLAAVFIGKALLNWANEWLAQRTSAAVKSQLRKDIMAARLEQPLDHAESAGLVTLVTKGLDGLDGYFAKYLPQLLLAVTVPVVIGIAVLRTDLLSALILFVTLPLIPLFMALVGWTTEAVTRKRWAVQTRLANHFADLIAGLPTLQVFGRARAQAEGLRRSEARHRSETMLTLRISFLSALVLELLATLSVAVIAVTIGFRVVFGEVDLATALFVLILAPEAYLPVRQVGTHYHDAADGLAAVDQAFAVIDGAAATRTAPDPSGAAGAPEGVALAVDRLTHTYPGADTPALAPISFVVPHGGLVALAGPSGAGKTTILNAVMGFLQPTSGSIKAGVPNWRERIAWVGQTPGMIAGTVADNVRLGFPQASTEQISQALRRSGGGELRLDQRIGDEAEGVSAGERRRIAVARALLRVESGAADLLVLDEPTAGLDSTAETELLAGLRRSGVSALVVSHRSAVLAAADRVVTIAAPDGTTEAKPSAPAEPIPPAGDTHVPPSETREGPALPEESPGEPSRPGPGDDQQGTAALLRRLFAAVPGSRGRLVAAIALAFAATGASVALMGVSGWLLSRAAEMPPVLYLQAAAVSVRFFGISRGGFRYLERLVGHDVALRLQSALRLETYSKLARTTLLGRRRGDLLARVIADTEAIQDLVVRVWVPFSSALIVLGFTAVILGWFSPGAALVLLASSLLAGFGVPWLTRTASARADAEAASLRGELADSVRQISRTAADLKAFGRSAAALAEFAAIDGRLRANAARSAWVRGIGSALQVVAAGVSVMAALAIGSQQVADHSLAPVMLSVLVLTPLALHEALSNLIAAAQTRTQARAALRRVAELVDAPPVGNGDQQVGRPTDHPLLEVDQLSVGWPGAEPVVNGLSLRIDPGERVALVGPSGIGKTTVAATLLGLIPARGGNLAVSGRIGYLAQDAHIFTTTVAENVRIGNRDATPAQIETALRRAGLTLSADRMIGEAGDTLSGGEARRVALARLLVGDYQVLILDEPTEHLDSRTATALIDDIWADSARNPVLVITHDPVLAARCDRVVRLG